MRSMTLSRALIAIWNHLSGIEKEKRSKSAAVVANAEEQSKRNNEGPAADRAQRGNSAAMQELCRLERNT